MLRIEKSKFARTAFKAARSRVTQNIPTFRAVPGSAPDEADFLIPGLNEIVNCGFNHHLKVWLNGIEFVRIGIGIDEQHLNPQLFHFFEFC